MRDTYGGNYSTRLAPFAAPNSSVGVAWNASATETDARTGATTWHGAEGALEISVAFGADGVPLVERVSQPGWQRTILAFSNFTTEVDAAAFALPACFNETA